MNDDLLSRLDRILNEVNDAIDEMDPDGEEAGLLFGPVQELGYAVDQLLTIQRGKPFPGQDRDPAALAGEIDVEPNVGSAPPAA